MSSAQSITNVRLLRPLRDDLAPLIARHAPRAVAERHAIHRHPELANREFETAARVAGFLRSLGLEPREHVAHTGVVATIEGGRPGPAIALRADMDALPVTERSGLSFASRRTVRIGDREVGVSHACGHDVHTAVLLGVAAVLADLAPQLTGSVRLLFQPAEEGAPDGESGGAALMVREGVLAAPCPAALFALHTEPDLDVGQVGFTPGPAWAAVDHFRVRIVGEGSHGAKPERGVDPVVMAAAAVGALQTIRSRELSSLDPAVVSICRIHGGERFNVIPDEVCLEGTVRTYDDRVRDLVERRMAEILDGVTLAHGGSYELDYRRETPPVVNDRELAARAVGWLGDILGAEAVRELPPSLGGEDFAHLTQEIPGFYFRLGSRRPGRTSGGFHTPTFRADDAAVAVGMHALASLAWRYLTE